MADPKVIYDKGKYYVEAPSADWSGMPEPGNPLFAGASGAQQMDLQIWAAQNIGGQSLSNIKESPNQPGVFRIELKDLGKYAGSIEGAPRPGAGSGQTGSVEFENYTDAQAYGNQTYGVGTENVRWWVGLGTKGKPMVNPIQPDKPKPKPDKRIISAQDMPGTNMVQFTYADGSVSNPIARAKEPERGVGASSYTEGVRQALQSGMATIAAEDGMPTFAPGYTLVLDDDPSSGTFQKWVMRTTSSMRAADLARARRMSEDELKLGTTQLELQRIQANINRGMPSGGVSGQAQPIYDQSGNIIQYAIQEYNSAGELTTKYVKPPEQPAPTVMAPPDPAAQVVGTPQGMYQYADNEWSPLGMSEKPATLEMQGGMMWMRDTNGSLSPVNDVLERMIEQKIIEGDWDAALQWDDFRNRPSPQEHLQAMLDYARTPADQMLLSAIARGYSEGAVPPNAGELGRVGPVPAEAREAWERYQRSITGTGSEMSEMQAFLKEESDTRNTKEEERIAQDDARWQGLADVVTEFQTSTADQITAMQDNVAGMFNSIADSAFGEAFGVEKFEVAGSGSFSASPKDKDVITDIDLSDTANIPQRFDSDERIPEETRTEYFNRITGQENMPVSGSGTIDSPWLQEGVSKDSSPDANLLELVNNMVKSGEWEGGITSLADKQWWMQKLVNMGGGGIGAKLSQNTIMDLVGMMGRNPDLWEKQDPNARTIPLVNGKPFHGGVESGWKNLKTDMVSESTDAYKNRMVEEQAEKDRIADAKALAQKEADARAERDKLPGGKNFVPTATGRTITPRPGSSGAYQITGRTTYTQEDPSDPSSPRRPNVTPLPTDTEAAEQFAASIGDYTYSGMSAPMQISDTVRQDIGSRWAERGDASAAERAAYAGVSAESPDLWDWEGAEGGIVHGPTVALLGEKEPEIVIPLSKLPKMAEGGIVFSSAEQQPVGIQELLAGRSPRPLGGRLLNQAGMTLPSAQSWRNLSSDEQEIYTDLGARAGITPGYMQSELESARPSGGGGAGQASMLPLATRRIFR